MPFLLSSIAVLVAMTTSTEPQGLPPAPQPTLHCPQGAPTPPANEHPNQTSLRLAYESRCGTCHFNPKSVVVAFRRGFLSEEHYNVVADPTESENPTSLRELLLIGLYLNGLSP